MKQLKLTVYSIAAILFVTSCQKEISFENGTNNPGSGNGGNPPLGTNCIVKQIVSADSATGVGLFALTTFFDGSAVATKVEAYDSTSSQSQFSANLQYSGDTVRVSPVEYFLVDATKKIYAFHTYEDPTDTTTEKLVYDYTYDGNGYLIRKNISIESIPIPVVSFAYTWTGGNLVSIDGSVPVLSQKVMTATLEYDGNKTAKNFIYVFPDGYEIAPYILALNLGQKNKNVVNKISVQVYDENGSPADNLVTTFKNFVFSGDGYLLQWYAQGDSQDGTAIGNGLTKFNYFCR